MFDVSVVDQPFYNATDVVVAKDNKSDDFMARREELRKQHEEMIQEEARKLALKEAKAKLLEKLG